MKHLLIVVFLVVCYFFRYRPRSGRMARRRGACEFQMSQWNDGDRYSNRGCRAGEVYESGCFCSKAFVGRYGSSDPAAPGFTVREQGDEILIMTDKLMISVDRSTGGIAYSDLRGRVVLAEDGRAGKTMAPATLVGCRPIAARRVSFRRKMRGCLGWAVIRSIPGRSIIRGASRTG